jgi:hypothetical protein
VSQETLKISITHWENFSRHFIELSQLTSYYKFVSQAEELFPDGIGERGNSRLYTLPYGSEELNEKSRLTAENFAQFKEDKLMCRGPRLLLYFSNTGSTPTKLPRLDIDTLSGKKHESSEGDSKSKSSKVSRNPTKALECKERDNFTCRLCEYTTDNVQSRTKLLNAAHIYEVEEHKAIPDIEVLKKMGLYYGVNDLLNIITLCVTCHPFFDNQQIGIDPELKTYIFHRKHIKPNW